MNAIFRRSIRYSKDIRKESKCTKTEWNEDILRKYDCLENIRVVETS